MVSELDYSLLEHVVIKYSTKTRAVPIMNVSPGVNNFIRWVFNFCLFLSWYYRAKCLILGGGIEDDMIFIARTVIL